MIKRLIILIAFICLLAAILLPSYEFSTGLPDTVLDGAGGAGYSHISTKDLLVIFATVSLAMLLITTISGFIGCI